MPGWSCDIFSPVTQLNNDTIIEIRPFKGGWQCYERPGVAGYWTGQGAKQSAIDYAKARAKFGQGEIRILKQHGGIESIIAIKALH
jgi:hypothetical protein